MIQRSKLNPHLRDSPLSLLSLPSSSSSYNPTTGKGALGVEFAGTAVSSGSSFGNHITPAAADALSHGYVQVNPNLQWSEGSFRGFFTLTLNSKTATATYYAMRDTSEFSLSLLEREIPGNGLLTVMNR